MTVSANGGKNDYRMYKVLEVRESVERSKLSPETRPR